ncbi:transcriptional regulator with XRE-family HTH domain [Kibdelosporangium banguiense]|uniref:Transcriptional regulator with XRE-family HTH domain n=1 Tax=Kibdelosporangium banguiense TaxID=1365924 RepID=A0ABS4U2A6_9PSEU|nr:helix-turn-helix transcriptional regulator [Kibdelosporangium banguiense]MBP2330794.1 transcriptional regulator with XRE-family HTH domain [Kibdelosporangium banguiense]
MARTSLSLPFSGSRLRHWRERAGLIQQALAERCGLSRFQISRWETGDAKPEPGSLRPLVRGLAAALGDHLAPFELADLLDSPSDVQPKHRQAARGLPVTLERL